VNPTYNRLKIMYAESKWIVVTIPSNNIWPDVLADLAEELRAGMGV